MRRVVRHPPRVGDVLQIDHSDLGLTDLRGIDAIVSKAAVRVLIVDDQPVVRRGLASLFRRQIGLKLAEMAHSNEAAMALLKRTSVGLVFLDLRMSRAALDAHIQKA